MSVFERDMLFTHNSSACDKHPGHDHCRLRQCFACPQLDFLYFPLWRDQRALWRQEELVCISLLRDSFECIGALEHHH